MLVDGIGASGCLWVLDAGPENDLFDLLRRLLYLQSLT